MLQAYPLQNSLNYSMQYQHTTKTTQKIGFPGRSADSDEITTRSYFDLFGGFPQKTEKKHGRQENLAKADAGKW